MTKLKQLLTENFIVYFITGLRVSITHGFLKIFGKIKYSKYPMWIQYDPTGYKITASEIRRAVDMIKPGDVIARRYECFLDGLFIPGRFSHTGIYIGKDIVVHAMGDGVQMIDIIDFLRCDGFVILRPTPDKKEASAEIIDEAIRRARSYIGYSYDFDFDICEDYANEDEVKKRTKSVYCHELVRSCFPTLNVACIAPSIWNGMIRSKKKQFLAQSFIDSPDFSLVYDSDYAGPMCNLK